MLIDGEKWACEACIRGHRVSSCQHSDRPLNHINRKGRPMSQCPHCRGLRKSRANHVKCECGSKPHTKANCPSGTAGQKGPRKQCCCSHTSRCICSSKKDSNVACGPGNGPTAASKQLAAVKPPHLTTFKSEPSGLSHRHKTRKEASRNAQPYSIPRSHTVHASSKLRQTLSNGSPSEQSAPVPPRRAVSEHGSPVPTYSEAGEQQIAGIKIPYSLLDESLSASPPSIDYQQHPMGSPLVYGDVDSFLDAANLAPVPVDWSTLGLAYGSTLMPANYSQPASYASFDYSSYGHLSGSSSAEVSEAGAASPATGVVVGSPEPFQDVQSVSDISDTERYRLSTASYPGAMSQSQFIEASKAFDGIDLSSFLRSSPTGVSQPAQTAHLPVDQFTLQPSLPVHQQEYTTSSMDGSSPSYVAQEPAWMQPYPLAMASPLPVTTGPFMSRNEWS